MHALQEWIDIVQADICRIFDRINILSVIVIPLKLTLFSLKWFMLAMLVPLKALIYNQP